MVLFKKDLLKRLFFATIGCVIYAIGIDAFLAPCSIAAGGFSGVSILINAFTGWPVGLMIFALNVPLFITSFKKLGKEFVLISLFGTVVSSAAIDIFSFIPQLTNDVMLCAIYGGLLVGIGCGIVLKYGATTGGTDLLAKLISLRRSSFAIGQILFYLDMCVILCSIILIGMDKGLYALISVFVTSKMIDLIIQGTGRAKSFFIITTKGDAIANAIMYQVGRGVTRLNATGAYTGKERTMLLCAVSSRSEISFVKNIVHKWDKDAFMLIGDMTEVLGEGFLEEQ